MSGAALRYAGTLVANAPVIKRAVATLSDGRVATLVIDTNTATQFGVDVTGVPKICVYLSTNTSRTAHTLAINYAPAVAPSSATRYAVASMSVSSNNTLYVVYQGVDNGLYIAKWTYSAGVFTFVNVQTIQGANAIVNRFRALDIDIAGTDRPVVICYEAADTAGLTATVKIRVLLADNTTWFLAQTLSILTTGMYIKPGSEDVSIAWRGDGIVSNLGRVLVFCTQTGTATDKGDVIREYSINVTTGATTTVGTWFADMHAKSAAGSRRAMIFTLSSSIWLVAGVYGTSTPRFWCTKLTTGNHNPPSLMYAGYVSSISLSSYFKIDATRYTRMLWTATYKDNRLSFGFVSPGAKAATRIFREIVFTFANVTAVSATPTIDQVPRPLDSAQDSSQYEAVMISGGDNKRLDLGHKYYNFLTTYVQYNTGDIATLPLNYRFVAEDTFDAPVLISPQSSLSSSYPEPTNRPVFRVRIDNFDLQPNLYGKLEIQIAADSAFTTDIKSIVQPDSAYQYFGNKDGLAGAGKIVSVQATLPTQYLFTGTWYWRARIVSDKDTPGAWSDYNTLGVIHPPIAKAITPARGAVTAPISSNNENMLNNPGATFGNTTGFTAFNGTLSHSTEQARTGTASFKMVPSGSGTDSQVISDAVPITSGQDYYVEGWIRPTTNNKNVRIQVNFYNASNVYVGDVGFSAAPTANTWTKIFINGSSSAYPTATKVSLAIGLQQSPAVGDVFYVDDLVLHASSGDVTFSWGFSDTEPTDQQTEYNLIVTREDTGAAIVSTGWVVSSARSHRHTFPHAQYELPLAWTVQLRDTDSTAGARTAPQDFTLGHVPQITILSPTFGQVVTTATPTITWSFVSGGNRTQRSYRISITDAVSGDIVADTQWRVGSQSSYTFPTNVLENLGQYNLVVMVIDTAGLYDDAFGYMTADWIEPTLANQTVTTDAYKVRVSWTNVNQDNDFISWRLYRRYMPAASTELDLDDMASKWVLLYETADMQASYQYDDYLCPLNRPVDYVVVQVADRFGSVVESNLTAYTTVTLKSDKYYFVPEVPIGTIASYESNSVTGDNFTREIEQETLHVIGRGRQVQIGDDLGYSGTLTLKLRNPTTARINREFLETLSRESNSVYIKTPFGDVVLVALGSIQTNRQPGYGGGADIVDITVPYLQVIAPDLIIRSV